MVIQSGIFVKRFGATGLVGWGAGYAILREVAPIPHRPHVLGAGGANNTAELGTHDGHRAARRVARWPSTRCATSSCRASWPWCSCSSA
jgi:hypothetical protein